MYNYNFDDEKVLYENINCIVSINDKQLNVSLLVTDKNILLFENIMKNNVLEGRLVSIPAEYELINKIDLSNISYKVSDGDTLIGNNTVMYNFDLDKIKNQINF